MGNLPESVKVGTDMITSTSNAQIKKIIQLNTKGKARRNSRAFVVEGVKMFLDNIDLEEIKEKVFINHVVDSGTRDALIMRMRELLKTTNYIANFKERIKYRSACNSPFEMTDDNLYIWEYDVITIKNEYIPYISEILKSQKVLKK